MITRRALIMTTATLLASHRTTVSAIPAALPKTTRMTLPSLLERAKAALHLHGAKIRHDDVVGIVDFNIHSSRPRFFLVNMRNGTVETLLVAHGRGSDPAHSGMAERFSNLPGSYASSIGSFVTGEYYIGAHGRSMRLAGLDSTNDNAEARAIIVHGAWYVSDDVIKQQGKLGRSEGCFAVRGEDLNHVLDRLGPGRLLYADRT
jgi:L,D-transpeptidase catalytic domain